MKRSILVVWMSVVLITAVVVAENAGLFKAKDPGPRPNPASPIPSAVPGLSDNENALFIESLLRASELEGSCDTCSQQPQGVPPIDPDPNNPFSPTTLVNSAGMSPVFNADQCFSCHFQPAIGGSSPAHNPAEAADSALGVEGEKNDVVSFEFANDAQG